MHSQFKRTLVFAVLLRVTKNRNSETDFNHSFRNKISPCIMVLVELLAKQFHGDNPTIYCNLLFFHLVFYFFYFNLSSANCN